jgi:lipoprotein-anchoring transpeptidase ErfK/SrfK
MSAERIGWAVAVALVVAGTVGTYPAAAEETATVTATTRRLIVSIPDRQLVVVENEQVVEVFAVAVGAAATPSPIGTFTIVNRVTNPTYYHPGKVVPFGPRNPLGTRWIGLSQKGYGIHGTDAPQSVGYAKSHGCIRLRNADVERLFERVRAGDVVELHGERTPEIERYFAGNSKPQIPDPRTQTQTQTLDPKT